MSLKHDKRLSAKELEMLLNYDHLHCKPPFKNQAEECQYYARYIEQMLWSYLTPQDWKRLSQIVQNIRVSPKLKKATQFLIERHK